MRRVETALWISWEYHRRNVGISSALGCQLHQIEIRRGKVARYVLSALKTVKLLAVSRPGLLFAQNPSLVLAVLVACLKPLWRYRLIIDAHNSGILPCEGRVKGLMTIARWLQKQADLTIVTNSHLKEMVEANQGEAFVLPDNIPAPPAAAKIVLPGRINVLFICTYSADEPYREVIEAARILPGDVHVHITGRYQGRLDPSSLPENVHPWGFIPEDQYWSLLEAADLILVLTTRENCLVCGAYEGVAMGKPLILSDTRALRAHFRMGAVYVGHDPRAIGEGIQGAIAARERLGQEVEQLRDLLARDWQNHLRELQDKLSALAFGR